MQFINNPPGNDSTTQAKPVRVEVVGKGITVDLQLAPFSSLMSPAVDFPVDPLGCSTPSNGNHYNQSLPTEMNSSTLRAILSPLSMNIVVDQNGKQKISVLSRIEIQTRNYQQPPFKKVGTSNLNGSSIMKGIFF